MSNYGPGTYGGSAYGTEPYGGGIGNAVPAPTTNGSAVLAATSTIAAIPRVATLGSAVLNGVGAIIPAAALKYDGRATLKATSSFIPRATSYAQSVISVDPAIGREKYRLEVADLNGTRYCDLHQATLQSVSWDLNNEGTAVFSVPVDDPKLDHINSTVLNQREIRIWKGRQRIWTGVLVRATDGDTDVTFHAKDLAWYFKKRTFGKVNRHNYMQNPSFEDGLAHWNFGYGFYSTPKRPPYHEIVNYPTVSGERALHMWMDVTGHGSSALQNFLFTVNPSTSPKGDVFTLAMWAYVPSAQYVGPATDSRGLLLVRSSTTIPHPDPVLAAQGFKKELGGGVVTLDANTPKDIWVRMELPLTVPATGTSEQITLTLYPPNGHVYYDFGSLTINERSAWYGVDQALIMQGIVQHAQDANYNKSSLNIGYNCPTTGVLRDREYFHSEHQIVRDALDDLTATANAPEWSIEVAPVAETRTFTTHFPRRGSRKGYIVLELGRNLVSAQVDVDGEGTANSIIVLGDGEGSDREEGGATDTNTMGGLTLEKVYNATPGSDVKTLEDQAKRGLNRFRQTVVIPSVVTHEGAGTLMNEIKVGDIVPVRIKKNWVDVQGDYRIIEISLNPNTDQLTISMNPAELSYY